MDTGRSPYARLRPVAIAAVRLEDAFWAPRRRLLQDITLRQQYEQCELTGRLDNFRRAAGKLQIPFQGRYYNDSDVYKWLEAASFALAGEPDQTLEGLVDGVVAEIAAAQSPDGYLNTYFTFEREAERWTDLTTKHEMYCAGHLIQAAIAHHRVTGKRTLLNVAIRLADHICATFGPQARPGADGHEEIELAMVELSRETGDRRYVDAALFFLDQRGRQPPVIGGSPYHQDHLPVRRQHEIVGHAVRATYLACGMTDVAAETGDAGLLEALDHLWESAFGRKAYLTGGLGARWSGEAFGADYELPSERAYAETCAAIGGFMWNWRRLALGPGAPDGSSTGGTPARSPTNVSPLDGSPPGGDGAARGAAGGHFADWMETALYNGILSGLSLDGTEYFYQNPLADGGHHRRQPWFGTACCPPNIARLLLSLPGYCYSTSPEGLWVHLYAAGEVRAPLGAPQWAPLGAGALGSTATIRVETSYPWDGVIRLTVQTPPGQTPREPGGLFLRIPGWCEQARLTVNGVPAGADLRPGTYAELRREWRTGDVVELDLPMTVRRVVGHPRVTATHGRVALARGPLVYCLEGVDHPGVDVRDLELPSSAELRAERAAGLLGGVTIVRGQAVSAPPDDWDGRLYRRQGEDVQGGAARRPVPFVAIPYYAWANRAPGPMQVWMRAGD